jgi:hypothetical protein
MKINLSFLTAFPVDCGLFLLASNFLLCVALLIDMSISISETANVQINYVETCERWYNSGLVIVVKRKLSNCSVISWRDPTNCQRDDDEDRFVLEQHARLVGFL